MPVVGAHHQQYLLAPVAHPPDRRDDGRHVRIRRPHQRAMLAGAELHDVLGVVGLAEPERMQGVSGRRFQRRAEPAGGLAVAGSVVRDVEMLRPVYRLEPRPVGPAAVQQQSVPVRVLHVGGAGRGVEPAPRPAVPAQPLAQGGPVQGAPRRPAQPLAKLRRPHRHRNETVPFVEGDDVAVQPVGGGETSGGQRGGVHPGRGGEDRSVVGVPPRARREPVQVRRERIAHQVAAQSIDDDEDRATLRRHGLPSRPGRLGRSRCSPAVPRSARLVRSRDRQVRSTRRASSTGRRIRSSPGGAALDTPFSSGGDGFQRSGRSDRPARPPGCRAARTGVS